MSKSMGKVMGKKGVIILISAALLTVALLSTVYGSLAYYLPTSITMKVGSFIVYSNGTLAPNPNPILQFHNGGTAVLTFPNGTTLTFNIYSINGFRQLYNIEPKFFMKSNWAVILPIPNELKGWVMIRGINITLYYVGPSAMSINDSTAEITYTLSTFVLSKINRTDPELLRYIPYSITMIITRPEVKTLSNNDPEVAVYMEWVGKDELGLTVFTIQQWVEYDTDCVANIYWATAWIDNSGVPGYTFYNEITIESQEWSGWGSLEVPKVTFSTPASQVNVGETTSVYFGISENGYGVYGQVASATTQWTLYPIEIYYVASGTAVLYAPVSSGWVPVCT
jgi:hypothetical protein